MSTAPVPSSARCCWCQQPLILIRQEWRSSDWVPEAHYWCSTRTCRDRQRSWAYSRTFTTWEGTGKKSKPSVHTEFLFVPLPKQAEFFSHPAPYKLYGGAAGPGKSYAVRWGLYRLATVIPNFRALLLRESFGELEQTHFADMDVEQELVGGKFIKGDALMYFPHNKSRIIGGHMQDAAAVRRYLSTNYDVIVADEGAQFPPEPLLELTTRARTAKPEARRYVGDGQVWIATNPGGQAAAVLDDFFISHTPDFEVFTELEAEYRPEEWVFTPALLDDNPYSADSYKRKLAVLPSWRFQQLRYGDWSVREGQFFEHFSAATHGREVTPPPQAEWVEAMDWGYTSPGCLGFFFHVGDNHWHCAKAIKFTRTEPEHVAQLVTDLRAELGYTRPRYGVADPSIFSQDRGESIAETFARPPHRVNWQPATNRRTSAGTEKEMGWPRLGSWFRIDPAQNIPWLTFDPLHAKYLLRSIPMLKADKHRPDDVDTSMDDHGADMTRYWAMSRPPLASRSTVPVPVPAKQGSWGWWKQYTTIAQGASA